MTCLGVGVLGGEDEPADAVLGGLHDLPTAADRLVAGRAGDQGDIRLVGTVPAVDEVEQRGDAGEVVRIVHDGPGPRIRIGEHLHASRNGHGLDRVQGGAVGGRAGGGRDGHGRGGVGDVEVAGQSQPERAGVVVTDGDAEVVRIGTVRSRGDRVRRLAAVIGAVYGEVDDRNPGVGGVLPQQLHMVAVGVDDECFAVGWGVRWG